MRFIRYAQFAILVGTFLAASTAFSMHGQATLPAHGPGSQATTASTLPTHSIWFTLGTNGGPIAMPTRSEPSNLLVYGDQDILVDCGDGTAEQLAKIKVPIASINAVVISHLHFDHTGGLFGLMGMRYQTFAPTVMTIYGPPGTKRTVEALLAAMQPESESGRGVPGEVRRAPEASFKVVEIGDGNQVGIGPISVKARRNTHYSFRENSEDAERFQSLSFRFDLPDKSILYTGDTGFSSDVVELARNADLYVTEVGDPDEAMRQVEKALPDLPPQALKVVERHMREQHLTAQQVGDMAKAAGVKEVVLTHNSFNPEQATKAIGTIKGIYPGPVFEAYDLDKY